MHYNESYYFVYFALSMVAKYCHQRVCLFVFALAYLIQVAQFFGTTCSYSSQYRSHALVSFTCAYLLTRLRYFVCHLFVKSFWCFLFFDKILIFLIFLMFFLECFLLFRNIYVSYVQALHFTYKLVLCNKARFLCYVFMSSFWCNC